MTSIQHCKAADGSEQPTPVDPIERLALRAQRKRKRLAAKKRRARDRTRVYA